MLVLKLICKTCLSTGYFMLVMVYCVVACAIHHDHILMNRFKGKHSVSNLSPKQISQCPFEKRSPTYHFQQRDRIRLFQQALIYSLLFLPKMNGFINPTFRNRSRTKAEAV